MTFKDTSKDNDYGWGNSFNGKNNKLTVTNNSTCLVVYEIFWVIDTEAYPCLTEPDFGFTTTNENGSQIFKYVMNVLSYSGDQTAGAETSTDCYLNVGYTAELADMHNYNFNNAKIGQWTITLNPQWQTL